MNASEETRKLEEQIVFASKWKVRKVESDKKDSNFECYNKTDGKPVHLDIDKEVTEAELTLALLPNRSEDDARNNNGETRSGKGNISVCRSHRIFELVDQLGCVPFFLNSQMTFNLFKGPTRKIPPKPRHMTMELIDSDYNPNEDK